MSNSIEPQSDQQRRRELLAGKVLGDLSEAEEIEVEELLALPDSQAEFWELERSAAAYQLAVSPENTEVLPESLRQQISLKAKQHVNALSSDGVRRLSRGPVQIAQPARNRVAGRREWIAWACCAAAVLLAVSVMLPRNEQQPSLPLARLQLIQTAEDLVQVEWSPGTTPFSQPVSGDVVWSGAAQAGYMRFRGMPANDPQVEQYQLWIIDPARDDEPIDGGVFDITAAGEVIVPIHAKLGVLDPQAFAVTIEKPGGVVVSTQERLPLLAAIQ